LSMPCEIWLLDVEDYDSEYHGDRDVYDLMEDVDSLFRGAKVRPSNTEDQYLACIDDDGEVLGGAVFGYSSTDDYVRFTFSVVVDPNARRQGIAGGLVNAAEEAAQYAGDGYELPVRMEAWVVNPNMAKLLDKMGFESTAHDGEWSLSEPYYEKDLG
jgi:GNAT superfamily N-acetyltransferase